MSDITLATWERYHVPVVHYITWYNIWMNISAFLYTDNNCYASPITNISSICKTINISSIQVHSRTEAMRQHCKHENDSVDWYVFGGGDVWKNPRGDQEMLRYHPPPGCSGFRAIFSSKEFFWCLPSSPRPKKWVFFYISFYCGIFGTFSRLKNCSLRCLSCTIAVTRWFYIIKSAWYLAVTT